MAEADTYGADKFWVVLKPIPIDLEEDHLDGQSGSPVARACLHRSQGKVSHFKCQQVFSNF